jgi:hypothetical protein
MALMKRTGVAGILAVCVSTLAIHLATAQVAIKGDPPTSAVAALSWGPGAHIRVYRSDGDRVTETGWDGKGPWYDGAFAVPGQSVSATEWTDDAVHIRVYVINNGRMSEYCWDANGPWYRGSHAP